ncbi:MAG: type II secretion system protein [Candidatus Paceibacterota bacterium]|jgi:prepilin-type N-terminal cleavage/methylation domain-containing protein
MNSLKKGFTLIELLVVIAILAILATVIVVIINPAELLKQTRDASRISDLGALNSAVALYLADVVSPGIGGPANAACASGANATKVLCTAAGTSPFGGVACVTNATTTVDGNGWIPVTLTSISSGSPLSRLPLDPVNSTTYFYAYGCGGGNSALNFEIDATMESAKYTSTSTGVMRNADDGGNNANWYEVGNSLVQ